MTGNSAGDANDASVASCNDCETLSSCGIDGWEDVWGTYSDPSNPNTCIASQDTSGQRVRAVAVCCAFPFGAINSVITIESEDQQNLQVITECPSNSILTGCQVNRQSGTINQTRGVYSGPQQSTG